MEWADGFAANSGAANADIPRDAQGRRGSALKVSPVPTEHMFFARTDPFMQAMILARDEKARRRR